MLRCRRRFQFFALLINFFPKIILQKERLVLLDNSLDISTRAISIGHKYKGVAGMLIQSNPIQKSNPIDQILGNRYRDFSNRYFSLTIQSISTIENFIDFSSIFLSIFLDNFIDISRYFHRYFSIFSSIFLDISRYFYRFLSLI